jgi:hypothetical protein
MYVQIIDNSILSSYCEIIINREVLIFMDFVVHKVLSRKNIMLLAHQIKEKSIVIYIYYIWKHHDQYTITIFNQV